MITVIIIATTELYLIIKDAYIYACFFEQISWHISVLSKAYEGADMLVYTTILYLNLLRDGLKHVCFWKVKTLLAYVSM